MFTDSSSDMLTAAVWGGIVVIFIEIVAILIWLRIQAEVNHRDPLRTYIPPQSPPAVSSVYNEEGQPLVESCNWFNVITDFIFQQLRDSHEVKMLVMKQINNEFSEFLQTKAEGKLIQALTVREYFFGESLPVLSNIILVKSDRNEDTRHETIEINLSVDYSGGFELAIDAELMFNRTAFINVKVNKVHGRGTLCFTREPHTHWWFNFHEEPQMKLDVSSRFEGRNLPHLSNFLEFQLRRWVRNKHTRPNHKLRFKPFFKKFKYSNELQDIYVHNELLSFGELDIQIVECTRLTPVDRAIEMYCTLSIDSTPQAPVIELWQNTWPVHEYTVIKDDQFQKLGIRYKSCPFDDNKTTLIVITQLLFDSLIAKSGLRKGDVIYKIDNVKVTSLEQTNKLLRFPEKTSKSCEEKVLITIRRPTIDILKYSSDFELSQSHVQRRYRSSTTISKGNDVMQSNEGIPYNRGRSEETIPLGIDRERAWSNPPLEQSDDHRPLIVRESETKDDILIGSATAPSMSHDSRSHDSRSHDSMSHDRQYRTKRIAVSRNPVWNEQFRFIINSREQKYLNICLICSLQGNDGDILIGYVSLSLTDIAVECSHTSSGYHQQIYVLVPAKLSKTGTSRAVLKLSSGHTELPVTAKVDKLLHAKKYVGDILLRFVHTPFDEEDRRRKSGKKKRNKSFSNDSKSNESNDKKFMDYHPFTVTQGCEPRRHHFISVTLKRADKKCHVCSQQIWKKAWRCTRCLIIVDKKHVSYCKEYIACYKSNSPTAAAVETNDASSEEWETIVAEEEIEQTDKQTMTRSDSEGTEDLLDFDQLTHIDQVSHNIDQVSHDVDQVSHNIDQVSHDIDQVSHDIDNEELKVIITDKILKAQQIMEHLVIDKQQILMSLEADNVSEEDKEKLNYELIKNEAKYETTELILRQDKENLRCIL